MSENWIPKVGEIYWYISIVADDAVIIGRSKRHDIGRSLCDDNFLGNIFRTKKEAQEALKKIKEILMSKNWVPKVGKKHWWLWIGYKKVLIFRDTKNTSDGFNSFRTKKEAQEALKAIKEILK